MQYLDIIKDGTLYRAFYNHTGTLDEWDEKVADILEDIKNRNRHGKISTDKKPKCRARRKA